MLSFMFCCSPPNDRLELGAGCLLLGRRRQGLANLFATQLDAENALHLAENDVVWNATTRLVVVDDLRLLVDFRREILLTDSLRLTALLDCTGHGHVDSLVFELFGLAVELGGVEICAVLLVGAGVD